LLSDCRRSVPSRKFLPEARDAELHRNRQEVEARILCNQGIGLVDAYL
jgi:hypothetical protein